MTYGDDGSGRDLIERARDAARAAYCPYSKFPVGAAVLTDRGLFTGCNIENASFGLSVCAERVAIWSAVAAGAAHITQLAVSCLVASAGEGSGGKMPCGACRQVIAEFMEPEGVVWIDGVGARTVRDLLPEAFRLAVGENGA